MQTNENKQIDTLIKFTDKIKNDIISIREFAEDNNLLNEQAYLDFEDFLNKISNMDPTAKIKN